jgi:hypothetical protein
MDRNSQSSLASRAIAFFRRVRSFLSTDPFRPEHRPPVVFSADTSLITIPRFVPAGFVHGIEILNDNSTPMEFVAVAARAAKQNYALVCRAVSVTSSA